MANDLTPVKSLFPPIFPTYGPLYSIYYLNREGRGVYWDKNENQYRSKEDDSLQPNLDVEHRVMHYNGLKDKNENKVGEDPYDFLSSDNNDDDNKWRASSFGWFPFTVSPYTDISKIAVIEISIKDIETNLPLVNTDYFPTGTIIQKWNIAQYIPESNQYAIGISRYWLSKVCCPERGWNYPGPGWIDQKYYKIQVRFYGAEELDRIVWAGKLTHGQLDPLTAAKDILINELTFSDNVDPSKGDIDPGDLHIIPRGDNKVFTIHSKENMVKTFLSVPSPNKNKGADYLQWIKDNQYLASEWSAPMLVRCAWHPELTMEGSSEKIDPDVRGIVQQPLLPSFKGRLDFLYGEKESLKSYRIAITKSQQTDPQWYNHDNIADSGWISTNDVYADDSNSFYWKCKTLLESNTNYCCHMFFKTTNDLMGYQAQFRRYNVLKDCYSQSYYFKTYAKLDIDKEGLKLGVTEDIDNARNKIELTIPSTIKGTDNKQLNFIILRTDEKSDFKEYEEIHIIKDTRTSEDQNPYLGTWYDYTIESGVWYKYAIQFGYNEGERSEVFFSDTDVEVEYKTYKDQTQHKENKGEYKVVSNVKIPFNYKMMVLDEWVLTTKERQLKFTFNGNVSNVKKNIQESKQETLGGKFPIIRRNSAQQYMSYSLSGTISILSDDDEVFITKKEMVKSDTIRALNQVYFGGSVMAESMSQNLLTRQSSNFITEKQFREQVIEFLNDSKAKLLRTPSEGNKIVKLMNVSLTPNSNLKGMIYDFSAEAVEIADCSIDNYDYHGIQSISVYEGNQASLVPIVYTPTSVTDKGVVNG